jgi:hypothetical protein
VHSTDQTDVGYMRHLTYGCTMASKAYASPRAALWYNDGCRFWRKAYRSNRATIELQMVCLDPVTEDNSTRWHQGLDRQAVMFTSSRITA